MLRRALAIGVAAMTPLAWAAPDSIEAPLEGRRGDAERGRAIVADRSRGLCLLCHSGPFPDARMQGTLAPDLAGAGSRWTAGQLRQRIVDARAVNPDSGMPAFHRVTGLEQVGRAWQGRPILDAQQVEDVVAFLATLRSPDGSGSRDGARGADDGAGNGQSAPRESGRAGSAGGADAGGATRGLR